MATKTDTQSTNGELSRFYLWPYIVTGIINPLLLLFAVPITNIKWLIAFYLSYSIIWPITYVTYPVFYRGLENLSGIALSQCFSSPSCFLENDIFTLKFLSITMAFILPLLLYGIQLVRHKKYVEKLTGETLTYFKLFDRYIS